MVFFKVLTIMEIWISYCLSLLSPEPVYFSFPQPIYIKACKDLAAVFPLWWFQCLNSSICFIFSQKKKKKNLGLAFWNLTQVVGSLPAKGLRKNKIMYEKAWISAWLIARRCCHCLRSSGAGQTVLYEKKSLWNEASRRKTNHIVKAKYQNIRKVGISGCLKRQNEASLVGKQRHWRTIYAIWGSDEELIILIFNLIL